MDIMLDLRGAEEIIGNSKRIQGLIGRTVLNAMRNVVRRHLTVTRRRIRTETGIGRSLWGHDAAGVTKIVGLIRARLTADMIETGIKLKGLPAMIEQGGHTKPHTIKPKHAPLLAWQGAGGLIFAKSVHHPGSPVRAHGIAAAELRQASPELVREVDAALGKLVGNERGLQP